MANKKSRFWSPEEDEYLLSHCLTDRDKDIGVHLGRAETAVGVRLSALRKQGVKVPKRNKANTEGKHWKPLPKQWHFDVIPEHIRIT